MTINTEGTGERSLFVSYISEVPVWKSTYRIVLNGKARKDPLLQGWAIVDNTVGQDWDKVSLSLVAGAPQSFVQNVSQPFYARRPVIGVSSALNVAPQTYQATMIPGGSRVTGMITDPSGAGISGARVAAYNSNGEIVGQAFSTPSGQYNLGGLPDGLLRVEVELAGFVKNTFTAGASGGGMTQRDVTMQVGSSNQSVTVSASSAQVMAETSTVQGATLGSGSMLGRARNFTAPSARAVGAGMGGGVGGGVFRPTAQAQELGDLFEYKLKEPITIHKNSSALVPIVQASIGAEKVSIWNESAGIPRPTRALWLTNTTNDTLDGGSFSVLEEDTFAGEGIFEAIRPAEKRLAGYAIDLALNVTSKFDSGSQRIARVRISKGTMSQEYEVRERKTYTFRNEDSTPRTVIIEHPVRTNYELRGDTKPIETTASLMRFRLTIAPKETAALPVEEVRPLSSVFQISSITSEQLMMFVEGKTINQGIESALRSVIAHRARLVLARNAVIRREEVRLQVVVGGGNEGAGTGCLELLPVHVHHKEDVRHHLH